MIGQQPPDNSQYSAFVIVLTLSASNNKQLLDEVFVICGIINVEVSGENKHGNQRIDLFGK